MKNLNRWLSHLEQRHPVEIELGLSRINEVASRLTLLAEAANVVVVGGTNGKGSCVYSLEQLALAHGLRVATYTSPHIHRYNERIRVMGVEATDAAICNAFEIVEAARQQTPLTYFEMGTLAALVVISQQALDLVVLEVGLGGRYDAVNIIDADVAIITAIDIDHINWLGDNRERIAEEKAGIARRNRPLICADAKPPQSLAASLEVIGAHCVYVDASLGLNAPLVDGQHQTIVLNSALQSPLPEPNLPMPSVLAAVQAFLLLDYALNIETLRHLLASLHLAGRYQRRLFQGCTVIADVGHNPAAAAYLAKKLADEKKPLICVAAIMSDKDANGFVDELVSVVDYWCLGDLTAVPRATPSKKLGEILQAKNASWQAMSTIEESFNDGLKKAKGGTLVVCGSFYTVAAIETLIDSLPETLLKNQQEKQ